MWIPVDTHSNIIKCAMFVFLHVKVIKCQGDSATLLNGDEPTTVSVVGVVIGVVLGSDNPSACSEVSSTTCQQIYTLSHILLVAYLGSHGGPSLVNGSP